MIGNSGGGVYETSGVTDQGVAALGLNSDGKVCWRLTAIENAGEDLGSKLEQQFGTLEHEGQTPSIAYLAADFRVDAHTLESYMHQNFLFPVIGGLAADDRLSHPLSQRSSYLYCNRQIIDKAVAILAAYGPVNFSITVGNTTHYVGNPARVDHSEGNRIYQIDGIPAQLNRVLESHVCDKRGGESRLSTSNSLRRYVPARTVTDRLALNCARSCALKCG